MILGRGAYGEVIKRGGNAVKKFAPGRIHCLIQEYTALKYLSDCKHIVHAKDVNFTDLELTMELYDMSLKDYILEQDITRIPHETVLNILKDILLGLVELHDRNLAHGDVKPGNILMKRNPMKAVLGDCGFVSITKYARNHRTTRIYRDPNIVYDSYHDMFSFGICMLELIGKVRLHRQRDYGELKKIVMDYVQDPKYKNILLNLLSEDRHVRPSARNLLREMYSVNPDVWQRPVIRFGSTNNNNRVVMESLTPQDLETFQKLIKQYSDRYDIKRSGRSYAALAYWLNQYHVPRKEHKFHLGIVLLITASLFSSSRYSEQVIANFCDDQRQMRFIPTILKNMLDDATFRNLLLAPE